MDTGAETIADARELARVRRQAWGVHVKAAATAAEFTILAFLIPG